VLVQEAENEWNLHRDEAAVTVQVQPEMTKEGFERAESQNGNVDDQDANTNDKGHNEAKESEMGQDEMERAARSKG
jgi:hypothetical protein